MEICAEFCICEQFSWERACTRRDPPPPCPQRLRTTTGVEMGRSIKGMY
ncbi:unnamed protein product [Gulo gulo]|uniref:Uncharacterized protein n=1 Tax=Gulo gulo TaxID=48420 RepID=A0A9X9LLZ1_GULGU|nr:unnamed protein product [Gulo gulo]